MHCSSEEVTFICIVLSEETEYVDISIICLRGVVIFLRFPGIFDVVGSYFLDGDWVI